MFTGNALPNLKDVSNISGANKPMAKKKKWIAKATDNAHGQFKAKAEAAGKSTKEYAEEKKGAKGKLGKQARLAIALMGASHGGGGKKKAHSGKDARKAMYGAKE